MTRPTCPQCARPLAPDAPSGLCPACLLRQGMQATAAAAGPGGFSAPAIEDLAPLFPQLELSGLIGVGGMGAVYRARQPNLNREVALKILPTARAADPSFAERFVREAQSLARLSHPHVVTIHDFGETHDLYYLIMEFIDGVNLRQLMAEGVEATQALAIVPQVCDALAFAHEHGVVHRDIKPENILVSRDGTVKIADFGLAKLLDHSAPDFSLTGQRDVLGTLSYMAPEQVERPREVDHRADIYSLGVVFYELLTGELPLGRFDPPSERVQVDVRLDEVVLRALAKEPTRRYQSAQEMKTRILAAPNEPLPPAPPSGAVPPPPLLPRPANQRLSWSAVFSILTLPLPLFPFMVWSVRDVTPHTEFEPEMSSTGVPWFVSVPLSVLMVIAPTGLGMFSMSRIRNSAGRLYGLTLAVFGTLAFPLLLVSAIVLSMVQPGNFGLRHQLLPIVVVLCLIGFNAGVAGFTYRRAEPPGVERGSVVPVVLLAGLMTLLLVVLIG